MSWTDESIYQQFERLDEIISLLKQIRDNTQKPQRRAAKKTTGAATHLIISAYWDTFKLRRGYPPLPIQGKEVGQIINALKVFSVERLVTLIEAYLQIETPWFKEKNWDWTTFFMNMQKIHGHLQRGSPDSTDWNKVFGGPKALGKGTK